MTVAYNPKTGEYHYIKNHIEPKDFAKRTKYKITDKLSNADSANSLSSPETTANQDTYFTPNSTPIGLSGEDYSSTDHHHLRGSE